MAGYRSQHPCLYRIGNRQLYSEHSFCIRYGQKANQGKQFAVFFILAVGGLILNNVVLKLGTMVLDPFWSRSYIIVKPFATGVVMVYNFITRKIFIEKKPEKEAAAEEKAKQ